MGDWWETNRISHAVYNVQSRTLEGGGRTKEKAYRLHSFRPINTNRRRSMLTELPRQKSRSPRPSTPRTSRQQSSLQKQLPKLLVKQGQSSSVVTGHADWHAGLYRRGNNNANRTTKLDNKRKVNAMFQEKTFNVSTPKTKLKPKPQMRLMAESIKEDFKETQGIHEQTFSEKRRRSQKKIELMRYMYYKSEINRAIYLRCCMSIPNNRFIDEPVFMNETNNYDRVSIIPVTFISRKNHFQRLLH